MMPLAAVRQPRARHQPKSHQNLDHIHSSAPASEARTHRWH